ncbi:MAG TPA: hypothetical protein VLE53_08735 [Gemmatimonadaceae bacterium]|nr:hypothetical protein [Gemmatimonadaceae bacterium]
MFSDIRQALRDLLQGNVPPEGRRELLAVMKDTLVRGRLALDDLREGVAATRKRLERERSELETVKRRKGLAEGIGDSETVGIASRFEAQHAERVAILERKLEAQESELALAEQELGEMTQQYRAAAAGVGSGMRPGVGTGGDAGATDPLDDAGAALNRELDGLHRAQRRAAAEADADARLAELKRRMGK